MNRKRQLLLTALLTFVLVVGLFASDAEQIPDFAGIENTQERKAAFVDYLRPTIRDINHQRAIERRNLERIHARLQRGKTPSWLQQRHLEIWAKRYGIDYPGDRLSGVAETLLLHLDEIPTSMVLAQAALESAWGTSRFASEGNNFFGHWCFSAGCGMVPSDRKEGAVHEVRRFASAEASLLAYFRNINSHPAYQAVRKLRAEARARGSDLSGLELIAGLEQYSERGPAYIDELRDIIRVNEFE
ncbi:MAG: glucosaminidase domain-containing protein [Gammaproteobacteria bacterium]